MGRRFEPDRAYVRDVDAIGWREATTRDAETLGAMNSQLSEDEGAASVGPVEVYVERLRGWLEQGRYRAALATSDEGGVVAYVVWRDDPDYDDVFVRQFFVAREHRGAGLGRMLFEAAAAEYWPGRRLRLDVYDSNPVGGQFWERMGFVPFSRLMRREPPRS